MSKTSVRPHVLSRVVERPVTFVDYEPRGVPGFESNIAKVFDLSENQTSNLLEVADSLVEDHHFNVERVPDKASVSGSKGKTYPQAIKVTISPA